ncbi:MAG: hypothetical protein ABH823_00790 [bacterium]
MTLIDFFYLLPLILVGILALGVIIWQTIDMRRPRHHSHHR